MSYRGLWLASVLLVVGISTTAGAATRTWSGAVDANWATPGNWDVAPVAGDTLRFSLATANTTTVNNFPADTAFAGIELLATHTLQGNRVVLGAGGVTVSGMGTAARLELPARLGANQLWSTGGASTITSTGAIDLNGATLRLTGLTVRLEGVIAGAGRIEQAAFSPGFTRLNGANTYTGITAILSAPLLVGNATALGVADGTEANGTTLNGGGLFLDSVAIGNERVTVSQASSSIEATSANSSLAGPIVLTTDLQTRTDSGGRLTFLGPITGQRQIHHTSGIIALANSANNFAAPFDCDGGIVEVAATQALPGSITFEPPCLLRIMGGVEQTLPGLTGTFSTEVLNTGELVLNVAGTLAYAGTLTGSGTVRKTGSGSQEFAGGAGFTGMLTIEQGTALLDAPFGGTSNILAAGTLVPGSVTLGPVSGTSGRFAVGAATPTTGNLILTNTVLSIAFTNTPSNGRVNVAGAVSLGNSILDVSAFAGFAPAVGTVFTIIDNDGGDPVTGTFGGVAEGGTIITPAATFQVSYAGGTGNDVTLTVAPRIFLYSLAEGATGGFFNTDILLANPSLDAVPVKLTFFTEAGVTIEQGRTLPPTSRTTVRVGDIAGLEGTTFSTNVTSATAIVVERTMRWDTRGYGAHTEKATSGPGSKWYFAEGSQGFFSTFLLLTNPSTVSSTATVEYLREGQPAVTRTYDLVPLSRKTIDLGADPELVNQSFGITVDFTQPGVAERAQYFGGPPLWTGGHESAGVNAPSTSWFLAEGATGPFFETFVLLANPGATDATVTMTYLPLSGIPIVRTKSVPAHGRLTINVEIEDPALENVAVATQVQSTQPLVVERAQYWPDPYTTWHEAHNSFGVTELGLHWGLAEGRVAGPENYQTYILLANPGSTPANVQLVFLRDSGAPVTKNVVVPPTTRTNVTVGAGTLVPEIASGSFGVDITSDQPIVVERAMYLDAIGQIWAAGTNATGTRLP